jgi:hypothetical protein
LLASGTIEERSLDASVLENKFLTLSFLFFSFLMDRCYYNRFFILMIFAFLLSTFTFVLFIPIASVFQFVRLPYQIYCYLSAIEKVEYEMKQARSSASAVSSPVARDQVKGD